MDSTEPEEERWMDEGVEGWCRWTPLDWQVRRRNWQRRRGLLLWFCQMVTVGALWEGVLHLSGRVASADGLYVPMSCFLEPGWSASDFGFMHRGCFDPTSPFTEPFIVSETVGLGKGDGRGSVVAPLIRPVVLFCQCLV